MPNEIETYQGVIAELAQAEASVKRLVKIITDAAAKLQNWQKVMVANGPPGVGFPPELMRAPSIDCREWPDANRLAHALSDWHQAKDRVRSAYGAIPESQRAVVKPPQEAK